MKKADIIQKWKDEREIVVSLQGGTILKIKEKDWKKLSAIMSLSEYWDEKNCRWVGDSAVKSKEEFVL